MNDSDDDGMNEERKGARRSVMAVEGATLWPSFCGSVVFALPSKKRKKQMERGKKVIGDRYGRWRRQRGRNGCNLLLSVLLGRE